MTSAWEPRKDDMTLRRLIKRKIAEWFLSDEIAALNERSAQSSGALSDIITLVTDCLPKTQTEDSRLADCGSEDYDMPTTLAEYVELHKIAEAVLSRIMCSADRVRSAPSYFRHDWEEKLWSDYLGRRIDACASRIPCMTLAGRLSDRTWHVEHINLDSYAKEQV
jgi:hypothetical protein